MRHTLCCGAVVVAAWMAAFLSAAGPSSIEALLAEIKAVGLGPT